MLIVLVVQTVLVVTNMFSHVHTLTPCGDHSLFVGIDFGPTFGSNVLICFLEVIQQCLLQVQALRHASDGGLARDFDGQVRTLFHLDASERD